MHVYPRKYIGRATVGAVVVLAAGILPLSQVRAVVTNCLKDSLSGTACDTPGSGYEGTGSCADQVIQNGSVYSVINDSKGRDSSQLQDVTCIFQPRKINPNGPGCIDDGGQITFLASSARASGRTCPTS